MRPADRGARRLMAITDRRVMGADPLGAIVALARTLGPRAILQLREKDLSPAVLLGWLEWLEPRLAELGVPLLVNGRVDVARSAQRAGAHLPEDGLDVADARTLLPDRLLGASAHDPRGAAAKARAGADLVTLSPVFDTPSKRGRLAPIALDGLTGGLAAVRAAAPSTRVFALGGIDAGSARDVWDTGVDGVAVIRAAWRGEARAILES